MKIGFRTPSFNKSIAARTSLKRIIRHRIGLKAPKGFGWFTNPEKALYNRIYNRTSFSIFKFLKLNDISSLLVKFFLGKNK
jgi:hypothetical protein